jgi:hypothetical protein
MTARAFAGAVAMPRKPPMRSLAKAATWVSTVGDAAASAWNCRAGIFIARVGSVAR